MVLKIAVSEGHGLHTPGKRTPAGEREWTFNNKMGQGFRSEIVKYEGVQIKLVSDPTGQRDTPLRERTDIANNWGADLYLSLHHNANTGRWGTWTGTETYTYNRTTNPKSRRLAQVSNDAIVEVYKLRNRGLKKENFHELRETRMAAALTEGGYMDSTIDIKVMRNNAQVIEAGRNIARKVAAEYGLKRKAGATPTKPSSSVDTTHGTIYRVQVGSYSNMANAVAFAKTVEDKTGFSTYIVDVNGKVRVQVGAFAVKANAESRLAELKKSYTDAYIETNGTTAIDIAEPQNEVTPKQKSIDELAKEVINGDHGSGETRKASLGSRYDEVQRRVNEMSGAKAKSVGEMAQEVIDGKHSNGHDKRRASLGISQALYNQVHAEVTRKLNVKSATASVSVKVGDKVVIKNSASRYVTGQSIPASVKGKTYTVMQTRTGEALLKEIMSWVKTADITKGGTSVAQKSTPKPAPKKAINVGTRVTVKTSASKYATGENIPASIKGKTYTVQQKGTRNGKSQVLLKEIVSWVWESDVQ